MAKMQTDAFDKAYLRAGTEPPNTRVWRDGVDITDRPELWTEYERGRRADWELTKVRLLAEIEAEGGVGGRG